MKLKKFNKKADSLISKFQELIDTMEQKGNTTEDCQKLNLQQALNELQYCVNGTTQQDLNTNQENIDEVLNLYRTKRIFSKQDNQLIDDLIETGGIETDEIREDFKSWCIDLKNWNPEHYEDLLYFDEHYNNGYTHKENYNHFINSIK